MDSATSPLPSRATLVAVGITLVMGIVFTREVLEEPAVAIDEPGWLNSSYLAFELYTHLAPPSRWGEAYDERQLGDWGNRNPPFGKMIVGTLTALLKEPDDPVLYMWKWPQNYQQNLAQGNFPSYQLLTPIRLLMVGFAVLTLFLSYLLCARVTARPWLSLLAPLVLMVLPTFEFHATHVYMDMIELSLLVASALFTLHYFRNRNWAPLIAAGVCAGLACAVKFSAAPMVIGNAIAILWESGLPFRRRLLPALLALAIPFAAFTAVSPYLWPNPPARTFELISGWSRSKAAQQADPGLANYAVKNRIDRLGYVLARGVLRPHETSNLWNATQEWLETRRVYIAIAGILALLLLHVRLRIRTQVGWAEVAKTFGAGFALVALEFALLKTVSLHSFLVGVGLYQLILNARANLVPSRLALAVAGSFFAITAAWLPFDWPRYYLPVVIWLPLFVIAGVGALEQRFTTEKPLPSRLVRST